MAGGQKKIKPEDRKKRLAEFSKLNASTGYVRIESLLHGDRFQEAKEILERHRAELLVSSRKDPDTAVRQRAKKAAKAYDHTLRLFDELLCLREEMQEARVELEK